GGLLLLIGRFVPLGLTILGAIIVNILIFHTLMAPEGFPPGLVAAALELFLVWRYREAFMPLLKPQDFGSLRSRGRRPRLHRLGNLLWTKRRQLAARMAHADFQRRAKQISARCSTGSRRDSGLASVRLETMEDLAPLF